MAITIGASQIKKLYLGSTPIKQVYVGTNLVYSNMYEGYIEVTSIKSNGSSYINTGIKGNSGIKVEMCIRFDSGYTPTQLTKNLDVDILGSRSGDTRFYLCHYYNGKWCMGYGGLLAGSQGLTSVSDVSSYKYKIISELKSGVQKMIVDKLHVSSDNSVNGAATVINQTSSTSYNTNQNLYIGCCNNGGTAQWFANIYVYYCKIYQNGTLVRDFIPLQKESTGIAGLYDKVNNVFYTSPNGQNWTATAL